MTTTTPIRQNQDTDQIYLAFQETTKGLSRTEREEAAQNMAESLTKPITRNARSLAQLYRQRPHQQAPDLSAHFAFAIRSAADHVISRADDYTDQIAAALTDPNLGPAHIDEHLELAESNGNLYKQYIAFGLEDSRHAIMNTHRLPVHARALADALFHPISHKLTEAAAKDQGWLTAARKLEDAKETLVKNLSGHRQGYEHIAECLELIDQVHRVWTN